jgi:pre-mRNA-processing factor 17
VEEQAMDAYSFMVQQRTFAVHGYALNPSTSASSSQPVVGSLEDGQANGFSAIDAIRPSKSTRREQKRKRGGKGDAGVVDGEGAYMGPWAAYESEKVDEVVEVDEEAEEEWQVEKKRREEAKEAAVEKMKEAKVEKSIFHGTFLLLL